MPMNELIYNAHHLLGLHLTSRQINSLEQYEQELLRWNKQVNLTAIREPEQIRIKHFLDSLTCQIVLKETPPGKMIDIGTGAGFPGIPLKIIYPKMGLTLVESVGKKANFCRHIVKSLGLNDVQVIQERAEIAGRMAELREQFDLATARAVAVLPVLAEYLLPFVKVGGIALAMKGDSAPAEAHAADQAIRILGGHLRKLLPVTLPGVVEDRYLVVIDKVVTTPDLYPRRVGTPLKHPLKFTQAPDRR